MRLFGNVRVAVRRPENRNILGRAVEAFKNKKGSGSDFDRGLVGDCSNAEVYPQRFGGMQILNQKVHSAGVGSKNGLGYAAGGYRSGPVFQRGAGRYGRYGREVAIGRGGNSDALGVCSCSTGAS